jgi:dihydrofolate synthase/folylpolyglutamate synthase
MEVYFANKRIIFAIAMTCDAEYEQIIRLTHKYADWIITVAPQAESRALSSYELAAEVTKVHANVTAVDSPEEAVEISRLLAGKEDVIIAFGPHSFIRRLMEIAKNSKL